MMSRFEEESKRSGFQNLIDLIYEIFFEYFNYLVLAMTVVTTMLDVNVVNILLMFYSVIYLTVNPKKKKAWYYLIYCLDYLIMIK